MPDPIDVLALNRQRRWSRRTFGPDRRTGGVTAHIAKELDEIRAAPDDLEEWIDVLILAIDGAWRIGASPDEILTAYHDKVARNMARQWPDWRTVTADDPIEHVRTTKET